MFTLRRLKKEIEKIPKLIDKSRLTFKETTNIIIMLYYMYKIYQSCWEHLHSSLFCLFQVVEDKNTNENTEANDARPKRVGIRHFKDYFNSVFH